MTTNKTFDPRNLHIEDYTYELLPERIAKYPLEERDASKLLIYKDGIITENVYKDIAAQIPEGSLLVFNQTKVVHARLLFKKPTGGAIEVFCLEPGNGQDVHTAMLQKNSVKWKCLVGGASKWKDGMTLELKNDEPAFTLYASITDRRKDAYTIELKWGNDLSFAEVLHYAGKVPLPPYLQREAVAADEERYQTIFAKEEGSVAAPTAGLHFTDGVMQSLAAKNIDTGFVTLHVGAGTFMPVKAETMLGHDMHTEWIEADKALIKRVIEHLDKGIIAVGTTSMRTLESLYWIGAKLAKGQKVNLQGIVVSQWEPYEQATDIDVAKALQAIVDHLDTEGQQKLVTRTQILIAPGYKTKIVKGLITNFHQPRSTLLLLVAALVGDGWRNIYEYALQHDYRFLSYGDGCLLWQENVTCCIKI